VTITSNNKTQHNIHNKGATKMKAITLEANKIANLACLAAAKTR
jgi:predicted RNA-binding protein with PIN domain